MTEPVQGGVAARLAAALRQIEKPVAVAVSGGIDSLTLATLAHRLRPDSEMFHAVSAAVPGDATARVERLAAEQGWRLRVIEAGEFEDASYLANPTNRCFFLQDEPLWCDRAAHGGPDGVGREYGRSR